jgi:hypothetical protein
LNVTSAKNVTTNGAIARFSESERRLFQSFDADRISDALRRAIRHRTAITLSSDTPIVVKVLIAAVVLIADKALIADVALNVDIALIAEVVLIADVALSVDIALMADVTLMADVVLNTDDSILSFLLPRWGMFYYKLLITFPSLSIVTHWHSLDKFGWP